MAFQVADRVRETTTTEGTGSITLGGAVPLFRGFGAALSSGDTTLYAIVHQVSAEWEVGVGTYQGGGTLDRNTILESTNAGAAVNFSAGTKDVFITLPAAAPQTWQTIGEPDDPPTGQVVVWAENQDDIPVLRYKSPLGVQRDITQDSFIVVRNTTGGTLTKLSAVYINGSSGQRPTIALAKADSTTTVPAAGILPADIGNNSVGLLMIGGHLTKVNTSAFSEGEVLYVSAATAGALTATPPAFPNLVQRVGVVSNAHSSQGRFIIDADAVRGRPEVYAVLEATPGPPAAGVGLFTRDIGGRKYPAYISPSGLSSALQPLVGRNKLSWVVPNPNVTTVTAIGATITATGTGTAATQTQTSLHEEMVRIDYLVTAASGTAVAGVRYAQNSLTRGSVAGRGGFTVIMRFGAATGAAVGTRRAFAGLTNSAAAPTDVQPSSLVNMIGVGHDAADSNLQIFHNDASGTATKIDLGASFGRAVTNRVEVLELALFCPPNASFIRYQVTNLVTGAQTSGEVTTDIPANTLFLSPRIWTSVGGTSSVIGQAVMGIYTETDL